MEELSSGAWVPQMKCVLTYVNHFVVVSICYFLYGYGSGVCNGAHMYVWVHVYVHVWGAELDLRYLYSDVAYLGLETVSHLALNSPVQLGWLTSEPQRSSCLCIPTSGITGVLMTPSPFLKDSGPHTWAFQALCCQSSLK